MFFGIGQGEKVVIEPFYRLLPAVSQSRKTEFRVFTVTDVVFAQPLDQGLYEMRILPFSLNPTDYRQSI